MRYFWIGWCQEDSHDKVWGLIDLTPDVHYAGTYIAFWGRRGKKLQTKVHHKITRYEAERLCEAKTRKGYQRVQSLKNVYPEFEQDLEQTAVWGMLQA